MLCFFGVSFAADLFQVRHVSDGDTLILEDGQIVRLIGVDTPEMDDDSRNAQNARKNGLEAGFVSKFAEQAKNFTREAVEGRLVRLEYDWQRVDKYRRVLAYVTRESDGLFLNAEIIREGFGFPYLYFPFRYSDEFRKLGEEARRGKKGLWKESDP